MTRTRTRIAIGLGAAALAVMAASLGGALAGCGSSPSPAPSPATTRALQSGFAAGDTAALIANLQQQLQAAPGNVNALDNLGLAYEQRARETGDPAYYTKADGILRKALQLQPRDLIATAALGSLSLSRHRFADALRLGEAARAISPTTAVNYGVIGDAQLELGRYTEAFRNFDTYARLKPSLGAYARVSYGRELLGHVQASIQAMSLALDAAIGQKEATAWTAVQLGKIHWSVGRLGSAEAYYRDALRVLPGYVYAEDALALVEAAKGHYAAAIAAETRAVNTIPLPQFVATLGDLYHVTGREKLAREQYALIGAIQKLLVANGVKTDLEVALFDVDHGVGLKAALALARAAHAERPSIDGDDVLAWALARNGRCAEALTWSKQALRLGTKDALKFFHRGQIERCLGHTAAGDAWLRRALALNPHFSLLWAAVARKELS
jgi:tetratricopeptide (TPR) repeat protein